ncbi:type II toxin-antitoxin system VapC family toxin [uncultured Jatrophihabitans sp.]|uniref:type II toxin-antitoxin system VapC family toxin n=1 Tax=uncultured Jatrophihabitans sp. TaxID=1610747 RepID=UPI0035CB6686
MIAYLDTSAALRVLTVSPDAALAALTEHTARYLDDLLDRGETLVSSVLLRTEILCQVNRQPEIDTNEADVLVGMVNLAQLDASDLHDAPNAPGRLRTLDAIHLTAALRIGADVMIAYDEELRRAAQAAGLRVGPEPI